MAATSKWIRSPNHALVGHGPRCTTGVAGVSIALIPIVFVQTGINAQTGHDPSTNKMPSLWAELTAGLTCFASLLVP